jgi:hypothetical protein
MTLKSFEYLVKQAISGFFYWQLANMVPNKAEVLHRDKTGNRSD